jgi:hypothetical protein
MDDIVIIDNFLSDEELEKCYSAKTYSDYFWRIQRSTVADDSSVKDNPYAKDFDVSFLSKNLMDNEYYTSYLFNKIKKTFNQNYKLNDVYLNLHESLRDGAFHTDQDADRTVILYITDWYPAWGGFTHLMKSPMEHNIVAPIPKRLLNFKSDIVHKAYSYCNQNCPGRITVAFKLGL